MIKQKILSGKIYPDKSFSLGFVKKIVVRGEDKQYERDRVGQPEVDYGNVADWLTGVNIIEGKFQSISDRPLFIKASKSSQKTKVKYGRHGITGFGRRFVKNACVLLEQKYGKRRLGFATATLPDMDRATCNRINGSISDITRRFYQKIRRKYQKRGSEFIYVGCVEIQEKRFANYNIPAPHLHFVYLAKDSVRSGYTLNTKDFYTAWNESVNEVLKLHGCKKIMGVGGHIGSVKLEPIRASASAYIGKYLSKGVKVVKDMQDKGFDKFPKQWWTACMQLKKMFREAVIDIDDSLGLSLFYQLEHWLHEQTVVWARFVDVCVGGEYRTMGLVGELSHNAYMQLKCA